MKKLFLLLIVISPLAVLAQWSIVPSASMGKSTLDNNFTDIDGSKGVIAYSVSVSARYSFGMFFSSVGIGYQDFKSESKLTLLGVNPGNNYTDLSYSDINIPISVGFHYNKTRLYPIAEIGGSILFPTKLKDKLDSDVMDGLFIDGNAKSVSFAYFAQVGGGYSFSERLGIEAKFRYLNTLDVSDTYKYNNDGALLYYGNGKSTWQFFGAQVSLVVKL